MKKLISILLCSLLLTSSLVGCSQRPPEAAPPAPEAQPAVKEETPAPAPETEKTGEKLTFMSNMVGVPSDKLEQSCKDFTAKTGIEVEYIAPGSSYEEIMKTKMASKDLPDLWTTHGWSVARYSEYLRPLNDQPFAANLADTIKPVITDKDGNFFVLPVDVDVAGIVYNADVLTAAGVNVDDLKTWTDFEAACEKIKATGVTPIHIGGKDNWTIGQFFDWIAPSIYITDDANNQRAAFKDGTFDWSKWGEIAGLMDKWAKAGYFNTDCLTSDYLTGMKAYAEGKAAFGLYGNYAISEVWGINPNANMGMMPVPSNSASDAPSLIGGERMTVGVWKDTPNMDAALQLLNYLATPEVLAPLAEADALPAGLKGVDVDTGKLKVYYDKFASVETFPYFDREYLPTGMWDDMCITGAAILAGDANGVQNAIDQMKQSFTDKFNQQ